MRTRQDYEALLPYANDKQKEVIRACIAHGSNNKAAVFLGKNRRGIDETIKRVEAVAVKRSGPDYTSRPTQKEGVFWNGTTTLEKGQEGDDFIVRWNKEIPDKKQLSESIKEYVKGLCEEIPPRQPRKFKRTKKHTNDLMTGIFIGDAHIGMYAYNKETKHSDFNSDIATEQLRDAIDYLVDKAETTETGLLVDVGDYLHTNGQNNMTFSGTPQDVDTRQDSVQRKAAMCMIYMIDKMLDKFKKVTVVVAKGNHDTDSSSVIRIGVSLAYRNEKRVTVLDSDGFYNYVEYGNWLLGVHHGDKQKPESLAGSMARDMPQAWGRTTHRMWCVGHFHKEYVKVLPGVKYKVFAALPPPDSWHASKGYMGDGEMEMLTFRKAGGIYSSHVYTIPQVIHEPDARIK